MVPVRAGPEALSHFVSRFSMVFWRTISDPGQCTCWAPLYSPKTLKSWDKMRQLWFWDSEQYISVGHALMRHNTIKYRSEILSHETWYLFSQQKSWDKMKRRETEYLCVQYSFMYMKVPNLTDGTNIVNVKYITVVTWLGNIFSI